ncbi:DUF5753 domain-containing protein [Streptomyces sp. NPDC093109]|uniref:DUF5753 domain-containing protein n=1 Tax=Streptomyces sp. NPDC093109 TaxID=3154977 RepID=UPI00344C1F51
MRRQERLHESEPLILDVVLVEAALRMRVGGADVMRGQLMHLLDVSASDNIRLRVIPFLAGERGLTTGAFVLFSSGLARGSEADVAFTDSAENTAVYRDDPLVLKRLSRLFTGLSRADLSEDDSRKLIEDIEKEMGNDQVGQ